MGEEDLPLAEVFAADTLRPVLRPGATRVNTSIIDSGGATTKVNASAGRLSPDAWAAAQDAAIDEIGRRGAGWLVVSGALPPLDGECAGSGDGTGVGDGHLDLGPLTIRARELGARVALDTSGAALRRAAHEPFGAALLAPNAEELAELAGRGIASVGDALAAARELLERGAAAGLEAVYVSLGADGSLLVSGAGAVLARARAARVANTAGAGDASLAGLLAGPVTDDLGSLAAAAARAASFGAHAVAQTSTLLPGLEGAPEAEVLIDPDPGIPLTEAAGTVGAS
nr:PfkB family carbohydrate kinase [Leucobacter ruminantium]